MEVVRRMKKKLSEICFQDRRVAPTDRYLPYLGLEHIESQTGDILDKNSAQDSNMGVSSAFAFDSRHVLYSKLRPYLNKVALPTHEGRCTTELIPLLPAAEVDRRFLALLLRSPKTLAHATSANNGGRMPRVDLKHLFALEVDVPEISKQRRIAATLDEQLSAIADARQAAERRVKAAADMETALFRELFHGITPVVIGRPKEPAPAGWAWQRLAKLAELESGHTPSRKHPEWWGGDIPWIALPDIRALDGKVAMETKENTNPKGIANSSARILPVGTVMLSRTASVGFVAMMGRPMATSQDFVNWVCGDDLAPRFLMHSLRASREYLLANASGAIHKTIYMPAVKEFHLCLPDRRRQDQLTARLDSQLADTATLLTAARAELAAIQALPAAVLRRVFGTPDASAVVSVPGQVIKNC
jgi:type I restriction enzyme S subunit